MEKVSIYREEASREMTLDEVYWQNKKIIESGRRKKADVIVLNTRKASEKKQSFFVRFMKKSYELFFE